MPTAIPDDLARLIANRRVIPFIGAGFSASHGLPGWDALLRKITKDLRLEDSDPPLTYDAIAEFGNDDVLRIAEYLYLRAGASIGPLRHSMTTALQSHADPVTSTPHIELINLGAPQIYTTNFDEVIEATYRALSLAVEVVARSRDVATADPTQTQVVKYHGDLRYDDTLVLTESQYWTRLDFESPMDLKFRSDLLGKSVLFIGYSFRDINIRVIWFKLMQMMRDVPLADRAPSYIVRFEPNPVLESLYDAVGLRSIVLDPDGQAQTDGDRTELLSNFLYRLTHKASSRGRIPGTELQMFASAALISAVESELRSDDEEFYGASSSLPNLTRRTVPSSLLPEAKELVRHAARGKSYAARAALGQLAMWGAQWAPAEEVTLATVLALSSGGTRAQLLRASANEDWSVLWTGGLSNPDVETVLQRFEREIAGHESGGFLDDDVAYVIDVLKRIEHGSIPIARSRRGANPDAKTKADANRLLARAAAIYPAVAAYVPDDSGVPKPDAILQEIAARRPEGWEDIPF